MNRSFDPAVAVLGEEQQLADEDGSAPVRRYEMRVYRPAELAHLLCDAGFAGVAFQGDLLGDGAFRPDGPLALVPHAEGLRHADVGGRPRVVRPERRFRPRGPLGHPPSIRYG